MRLSTMPRIRHANGSEPDCKGSTIITLPSRRDWPRRSFIWWKPGNNGLGRIVLENISENPVLKHGI